MSADPLDKRPPHPGSAPDPSALLPGRSALLARLESALHKRRRQDDEVAVLLVDLDGLTDDEPAVRRVVARLMTTVRPQDLIGRLASARLLVIAPGVASQAEAEALAERVEQGLDGLTVPRGAPSPSVAVALCAPEAGSAARLLEDAEQALQQSVSGGGRSSAPQDVVRRERARVQALVRVALPEDRLRIHYQPVVDLPTRRVVGLEALMRLVGDDGSVIAPEAFLDVAAATGLLPGLDARLLRRAAEQVQLWRETLGHDLTLSVNVCAGQVVGLAASVAEVLQQTGLPAERLILELTEQTLLDSSSAADDAVRQVRALGVGLAIDDFGTGHSSLAHLRRFPVSVVKVDRSFVEALPGDRADMVIVASVVDLSRRLSIDCTVEGIATEQQYGAVLGMGTPRGQGHLFGHPTPAEQVPQMLDRLGVLAPVA